MATALVVTFIQYGHPDGRNSTPVGITSQTITFVDVGPAQKALDALTLANQPLGIDVVGVILKDVVI